MNAKWGRLLAAVLLTTTVGCGERVDDAIRRNTGMARLLDLAIFVQIARHYNDHGYQDIAIRDKEGKPLLSWRVAILQYVEGERDLYEQFHLDEPWDSEHNRKLIEKMPEVYLKPGRNNDGTTTYLLPIGKGTPFAGKEPPKETDIVDGGGNTILLVDAGEDKAVPWTKPQDLDYDPKKPLASLGKIGEGGFNAVFFDGSARTIPKSIDLDMLRAMFTHAAKD